MNKISKKIVALVTMAAFVLTLVPAAAFAAVSTSVEVQKDSKEITLSTGSSASATVDINVGTGDAGSDIVVWVEKDGAFYRHVTFDGAKDLGGVWANYGVVQAVQGNDQKQVTINFQEAGTYKVCAGVSVGRTAATPDDLDKIGISDANGTIVVKAAESHVDSISVNGATATAGQNGGTINYAGGAPNGIRSTEVVAQLTSVYDDGTTGASSEGKVLNVENPYSNFTISNADGVVSDENPIVADKEGKATFYVKGTSATSAGTYTLTLSADNATYYLSIVVGNEDNEAATIEAVDTGKTAVDITTLQDWSSFDSVAQFTVKNANGDVLTADDTPTGFTAFSANNSASQNNNNVGIVSAPEKGKNAVFKVVKSSKNTDNFTLQVVDASKLAVGEYTVRVSLDNNKTADVTFTLAKFGKVVDTVIEFTDANGNVVNEVVDNGTEYTATALQVDENGLTKKLTSANMGYRGDAVDSPDVTTPGTVKFKVDDDVNTGDNSLVGSKIGVWAFTSAYGQYAYGEVTVVDEDNINNYTLEFDPTNGPAGKDNTVNVTVVNEDGKKVDIDNADLYVYLADKSVDDANVYVAATTGDVENGEGKLTINSDKETDLEVIVGVRTTNNVIIANTLKYTVGEADVNADTTAVMTIGSTDYVVNNKVVTGDAAPFVQNDRTYVPFRALGETFGAKVDWDQDAQTVTYVLGDTTVVMTIGEKTYTVNGEEKTMDVAPVLTGDRTYVPVRFVAESLGYKVTPLYAADGTTASVVFQK